jgi:hypothetical protein
MVHHLGRQARNWFSEPLPGSDPSESSQIARCVWTLKIGVLALPILDLGAGN